MESMTGEERGLPAYFRKSRSTPARISLKRAGYLKAVQTKVVEAPDILGGPPINR